MKKGDLIKAIQDEIYINGGRQLAETNIAAVLDALPAVIYRQLRNIDNTVVLPGLGTLSVKPRIARTGRNPATGEAVVIPARIEPKFKPAKAFKESLNPSR